MANFTIKTTPLGIEIEANCEHGELPDVVEAIAKAKERYRLKGGCNHVFVGDLPAPMRNPLQPGWSYPKWSC